VHFNVIGLELGLKLERKLLDGTLGASVCSHAWNGLLSDGWVSDKGNAATLAPRYHLLGDRVHEVEHGVKVQVHMMVEGGDVRGQKHRGFANGCAADHHIDLSVALLDFLYDVVDLA